MINLPPEVERFRQMMNRSSSPRQFLLKVLPVPKMAAKFPRTPRMRDLSSHELALIHRRASTPKEAWRAFITMYARKQCRKRNEYWKALGYPNLKAARAKHQANREAMWIERYKAYQEYLKEADTNA